MLKDKFGIVFGVANKRSIAWASALEFHAADARLAFTYQGDRLKENASKQDHSPLDVVRAWLGVVCLDFLIRSRHTLSNPSRT